MSLQLPTVNKFFKEKFKGENPIRGTAEELKEFGKIVQQRIKGLNNISIKKDRFLSEEKKKRLVCEFSVNDAPDTDRYYYRGSSSFSLLVNEKGELTIDHWGANAVISDIEELMSFIFACQERVERQQAQRSKRKKLREFKTQAIIAQVKKMAKEEKFDFCTETDTVKLKLYVKLFENECIELQIPFSKFQKVLPDLRSIILSLRELHGKGIKFKFKTTRFYKNTGWISHESL